MAGLKGLSISAINLEKVKVKATNFLILYVGSASIESKNSGAAAILFAYVYKIDSGFIAKTGKLMPIKEPVVINFLRTNLSNFPIVFFFYLFISIKPPFSVLIYQSD